MERVVRGGRGGGGGGELMRFGLEERGGLGGEYFSRFLFLDFNLRLDRLDAWN